MIIKCPACEKMISADIDENMTQREINEAALEMCDCYGADRFRMIKSDIGVASENIRELLKNHDIECIDYVINCLRLISAGDIKEVTFKLRHGVTFKASYNKDNKFKLTKKTQKTEVRE